MFAHDVSNGGVVRLGPPKTLGRLTTNGRGVGKGRGTEDWIPAEDAGMTERGCDLAGLLA